MTTTKSTAPRIVPNTIPTMAPVDNVPVPVLQWREHTQLFLFYDGCLIYTDLSYMNKKETQSKNMDCTLHFFI